MSTTQYQTSDDRVFVKDLRSGAPEEFQAYRNFADTATGKKDGAIAPRWREAIAIAVALTTQCAYCLETHTAKAKALGVSSQELAEIVYITAALRAGAGAAHGMMAMKLFERAGNPVTAGDATGSTQYHESSDRSFAKQLREAAPEEFAAYRSFSDTAVGRKDGAIAPKFRELIAIAVALTTQCVYCLESHTAKAKGLGVTKEELAETVYVVAALRAGAAAAHGMMSMKLFAAAPAPAPASASASAPAPAS